MSLFIAKRFATLVLTLVFTSAIVFTVMEILPGDPALLILGIDAPAEAVASLRSQLGLDRPPVERYLAWLGGIAAGEFGQSYTYQVPVWDLIGDRLAITLPLTLF
ncbi:MAG: ABC transporter permease, partial [Azospirillaceae bacterium]